MRILQALLCLTLLASSELFGGDFIISLKKEKMNVDAKDFYIAGVIDGRVNKDNIGSAMLGIFNSRNDVKFEKEITAEIDDFISYTIPKDTLKTPVYLKILTLEVNEETRFFGEYATINMSLGFYKKDGDSYGELGGSECYLEESGMDVTDYHEEHIRKALEICIGKFIDKRLVNINPVYAKMNIAAPSPDSSSSSFADWPARKNKRNSFMFAGIVNVNSFGGEFIYSEYTPKEENWVYPLSCSFTFLKIKDTDEFKNANFFQFGFAFGALKPISKDYKVLLRGCIPLGTETIKYYDHEQKNFFAGLQFSQSIIFTPGDSGFGISLGIEEGFLINSELHPWDVGFKIGIGGGF